MATDISDILIFTVCHGRLEETRGIIDDVGLGYSQAWLGGYILLKNALQNEHTEMIKLLISKGSRVNIENEDWHTPLYLAVGNGNIEIVCMLLDRNADIDANNELGRTALHKAIDTKKIKIVEILLNRGANVNIRDCDGITPLYMAIDKGYSQIVENMLRHEAHVYYTFKKNYTLLHLAIENGSKNIVKMLLKSNVDVNAKTISGITPLHIASKMGYFQIVAQLLKRGACVNSTCKEGNTPLHLAAESGSEVIVKLLLHYCNNNNRNNRNITPPYFATKFVSVKNNNGKTPIFYAIEKNYSNIMKVLLTNGANVTNRRDLLITAIERGCKRAVKLLLQHGVNANACDAFGRTPLHFIVKNRQHFVHIYYFDDFVMEEIMKLLLSKGANINAQTNCGITALHYAIEERNERAIEILLKYNANVNIVTNDGITPLHISVKVGNQGIFKMLLNKGANVNAKLKKDRTLLHDVAAQRHSSETMGILSECGLKFRHPDEYGKTANVGILLKYGIDIDHQDQHGKTALHIACGGGNENMIASLVKYGSDINIMCKNGCTPLIYCKHSNEIVKKNYNVTDYNRTVRETTGILIKQIIKMETANVYVCEQNKDVSLWYRQDAIIYNYDNFLSKCKTEVAAMKSEKISNNISYYDILTKNFNQLVIYIRNENIAKVLKSQEYRIKFSTYASMIDNQIMYALRRNDLLEERNKISHLIFNSLPFDCTEKIFSLLSNKDWEIVISAFKPTSLCNPKY